ncbi:MULTISPECIES: peptidoglycan-binding domain-containing protein [Pseudovibrio]|uniref:peptidoglycan-binding domain-containing protein n=1 Tax=Stappiaceae TaxID=2821832 RepID=UPI002365B9A9|nr:MULTISPECIES: peptidoglycan-binding protein [Pseudovibrio]MDD7909161.1 peptidoglycan-binding protein [Pseudovibrio exalbescens]MDX5595605.1 peptidoglycan-binding protein [Pseudovibrio sp. SPO723]
MARRRPARTHDDHEELDAHYEYSLGTEQDVGRQPASRSFVTTTAILMGITGCLIVGNALIFQEGQHPAPLFATRAVLSESSVATAVDPQVLEQLALVKDVQRELRRLKVYPGTVDGLEGPATKRAVLAYERARGLPETGTVNSRLLARLTMDSGPLGVQTASIPKPRTAPGISQSGRLTADQISASTNKVQAVQQVLADLGYGPLTVDGVVGGQTTAAVKQFEKDRGLEVTGQLRESLVRELEKISGIQIL